MKQHYKPSDMDFDYQDDQSRPRLMTILFEDWRITLIFVLIVLGFIGGLIFLFTHPEITSVLRDIAIIMLTLLMFVMIALGILLILALLYLALKVGDLTQVLTEKTQSTFQNVDYILSIIYSRSVIISDSVVKPIITLYSYGVGIRAIFQALFKRN